MRFKQIIEVDRLHCKKKIEAIDDFFSKPVNASRKDQMAIYMREERKLYQQLDTLLYKKECLFELNK